MGKKFSPKLTELTEEQEREWEGFVNYEEVRGIRAARAHTAHLTRFFCYVNEYELDLYRVSRVQAQGYQTYLASLEGEEGRPTYAILSIKSMISHAKRFYGYLVKTGKVMSNPFLGIKGMKNRRRLPQSLPVEEQMDRFLDELRRFWEESRVRNQRQRYKAHVMAELMYATGMRMGEVLSLRKEEVDFEGQVIGVKGKGGRKRKCYLSRFAAQVLKVYVEEMRELINVNKEEDRVFGVKSLSTMSMVFHRYLSEAGKKVGMGRFTGHGFRHSLGYHLLRRGCDLRYIQLILGHEDLNSTVIYTKVDQGDLRNELDRYHPRQLKRRTDGSRKAVSG